MTTNLAQTASQVIGTVQPLGAMKAWLQRASRTVSSAMCGIGGHDPLLQVEHGRMFLRCSTCGFESPGWTTSARGPRPRFGGDAQRHRLHS